MCLFSGLELDWRIGGEQAVTPVQVGVVSSKAPAVQVTVWQVCPALLNAHVDPEATMLPAEHPVPVTVVEGGTTRSE